MTTPNPASVPPARWLSYWTCQLDLLVALSPECDTSVLRAAALEIRDMCKSHAATH